MYPLIKRDDFEEDKLDTVIHTPLVLLANEHEMLQFKA